MQSTTRKNLVASCVIISVFEPRSSFQLSFIYTNETKDVAIEKDIKKLYFGHMYMLPKTSFVNGKGNVSNECPDTGMKIIFRPNNEWNIRMKRPGIINLITIFSIIIYTIFYSYWYNIYLWNVYYMLMNTRNILLNHIVPQCVQVKKKRLNSINMYRSSDIQMYCFFEFVLRHVHKIRENYHFQ